MEIDLEYEFEQETNKCMWDVDGTYSGSYIEWLESKTKQLLIQRVSSSYYSCMDCEWEGEITECDFDTEYDEFKGIDREYPICPKCGSGLDC